MVNWKRIFTLGYAGRAQANPAAAQVANTGQNAPAGQAAPAGNVVLQGNQGAQAAQQFNDYGPLVDNDHINGRRLTYVHQANPERAILTTYDRADRDKIRFIFHDAHIPPTTNQPNGLNEWQRSLEQVIVTYERDANFNNAPTQEVYSSPRGGTFTYTARDGRVYPSNTHDPVAREIIKAAQERYRDLSAAYRTILDEVKVEARKQVTPLINWNP